MAKNKRDDVPDVEVQITYQAIIENIHEQYQTLIARLVRDNAEAQAGLDALKREVAELRTRNDALSAELLDDAAAQVDVPPARPAQVLVQGPYEPRTDVG